VLEETPEPTPGPTPEPTPTPDPTPDPPALTLHIADLDGVSAVQNRKTWQASATVLVVDASGAPIPDATVTISSWSNDGYLWDIEPCLTDTSGLCSLSYGRIGNDAASLTFTVDDVAHATHTYQPVDNTDPDGDSDGTTITVSKP
jgi:hypothetical protein